MCEFLVHKIDIARRVIKTEHHGNVIHDLLQRFVLPLQLPGKPFPLNFKGQMVTDDIEGFAQFVDIPARLMVRQYKGANRFVLQPERETNQGVHLPVPQERMSDVRDSPFDQDQRFLSRNNSPDTLSSIGTRTG